MSLQTSDVGRVVAKKNVAIDPLCDNSENLYQQVLVTSDLEAKNKLLDQEDVLDAQINQLEDPSQVIKWVFHGLQLKAKNNFMTLSTLSTFSYQQIQELIESQPNDLSEKTIIDFSTKVSTLMDSCHSSFSTFISFKESTL